MNPLSAAIARSFGPLAGLLNRCESPAEQVFAGAFLLHEGFKVEQQGLAWTIVRGDETLILSAQHEVTFADDPWGVGMPSDQVFARADFALSDRRCQRPLLLVDIDGHDYHERSKHQVRRDRSRDRHILRCGYRLARWTGSELNANPKGCAAEAFALALEMRGDI